MIASVHPEQDGPEVHIASSPAQPGLGLYLHLPFCPSRCPYCDFFSQPWNQALAGPLLQAMLLHLERMAPLAGGRSLASLYLGGGTPAMWPVRSLGRLLEAVAGSIGLPSTAEVTLEANPGALSRAKLKLLRALGVNRLSLGAQSFDDRLLGALGRRHSAAQTLGAVEAARAAGFDNLSLDLIYGLPGQTPRDLARDLEAALGCRPEHLSLYELTLSPNTPFGRRYQKGKAPLPSEAEMASMEEHAYRALEQGGLIRYEVSNFARPGRGCRHNQDIWQGGDYLALGPGAHGHQRGLRWAWLPDAAGYIAAVRIGSEPLQFQERLTPEQRTLELFMLGLRTVRGVDLSTVERVLGRSPWSAFGSALAEIQARRWAVLRESMLAPTPRGLDMADAAAMLFV